MKAKNKNNAVQDIIISGGYGYLATKLAHRFDALGYNVHVIVRYIDKEKNRLLPALTHIIEYKNSYDSLSELKSYLVSTPFIIHAAAYFAPRNNYDEIDDLLNSNLALGLHLLQLATQTKAKSVINVESYWQYDSDGNVTPNSLYAASKSAFSVLFEYHGQKIGNAISAVLYDVYGEDDRRNKLLSALVQSQLKDEEFESTAAQQIIDFIHIDDVVSAFETLCTNERFWQSDRSFQRFAIRTMQEKTLQDYFCDIEEVLGHPLKIAVGKRPYSETQIMNPWLPAADKWIPGWLPHITFKEGITRMANGKS